MGPRRAGRGLKRFLEAVGFILAEFEPKPSHRDPIHGRNYSFKTHDMCGVVTEDMRCVTTQEIPCVAKQEISYVAAQDIPCVATQGIS